MKQINLVFLSLLSILVIIIACIDKEETSSTKVPMTLNPYDFLGKIHNDGLSKLQKTFKTKMRGEASTTSSGNDQSTYVEQFTTDFINSYATDNGASPELKTEIEAVVACTKDNLPFIEQLSSSSDNDHTASASDSTATTQGTTTTLPTVVP